MGFDLGLSGKSVLVTGGALGIGRAIVDAFVAQGARVTILDMNEEALAEVAEAHGENCASVTGRVESLADNKRAVATAVERFGGLDVFIGNAGVGAGNLRLMEIPEESLESAVDELLAVNVKSYLLGARAAAAELVKSRGSMIFSLSIASHRAVDDGAVYVTSKHANAGTVRGLAWEFAPYVRVNGVAIGVARTRMHGLESLEQDRIDAVLPGAEEIIPMRFIPEPEDYAGTFLYLASDTMSRPATGESVWVDSGFGIRGIGRAVGGADLPELTGQADA
ncbi:MAG: SDR family oxidoreductase [Propionibacterium sp.]|nr:SDR family oxidoreductase [Propionibacterium sp.]